MGVPPRPHRRLPLLRRPGLVQLPALPRLHRHQASPPPRRGSPPACRRLAAQRGGPWRIGFNRTRTVPIRLRTSSGDGDHTSKRAVVHTRFDQTVKTAPTRASTTSRVRDRSPYSRSEKYRPSPTSCPMFPPTSLVRLSPHCPAEHAAGSELQPEHQTVFLRFSRFGDGRLQSRPSHALRAQAASISTWVTSKRPAPSDVAMPGPDRQPGRPASGPVSTPALIP